MHHILKQLMFTEQFYYAMADYPEKVYRLAEQMEPFFQAVQQTALDSPAEVVYLGGNYDDSLTPPPLFRQHILPVLKQYARTASRPRQVFADAYRRRKSPAPSSIFGMRF